MTTAPVLTIQVDKDWREPGLTRLWGFSALVWARY
jgi:hypothetical protein